MLGQKRKGRLSDQSKGTIASSSSKKGGKTAKKVVKTPKVLVPARKKLKLDGYSGQAGFLTSIHSDQIPLIPEAIAAWCWPFLTIGTGRENMVVLRGQPSIYDEHGWIKLVKPASQGSSSSTSGATRSSYKLHFHVQTRGAVFKIERGGNPPRSWEATKGSDAFVELDSRTPLDIKLYSTTNSTVVPFRYWPASPARHFGPQTDARKMYLVNPDHDVSAPPHTDHRIVPPPPTALLIVTTPRFFAGEGNSWKNTPSFIERDCFAAISATQDNGSAARRIIAKQIDRRVPVRANSVRGSTLYSPVITTAIDLGAAVPLPLAAQHDAIREPETFGRLSGDILTASRMLYFELPTGQYYLPQSSDKMIFLTHENPAEAELRLIGLPGVRRGESLEAVRTPVRLMLFLAIFRSPGIAGLTTLQRWEYAAHRVCGSSSIPGLSDALIQLFSTVLDVDPYPNRLFNILERFEETDWWKLSLQLTGAPAVASPLAAGPSVNGDAADGATEPVSVAPNIDQPPPPATETASPADPAIGDHVEGAASSVTPPVHNAEVQALSAVEPQPGDTDQSAAERVEDSQRRGEGTAVENSNRDAASPAGGATTDPTCSSPRSTTS